MATTIKGHVFNWPFSFGLFEISEAEDRGVHQDIAGGPVRVKQILASGENAAPTESGYLKLYSEHSPVLGEDAPQVVVPCDDAIYDPSSKGPVLGVRMLEDGECGAYFDSLSIAVNRDKGTGSSTPVAFSGPINVIVDSSLPIK